MIEHSVQLGAPKKPDKLLLQIQDTQEKPVVTVNLPNAVTIGVWPACSAAILATGEEPTVDAATDGDIRFHDGTWLSVVGRIEWPPEDPNPPGVDSDSPQWREPEVFDAVNRDSALDTYDLAEDEK